MREFETSQKDESRAQSADSSKTYRKPSGALKCNWYNYEQCTRPHTQRRLARYVHNVAEVVAFATVLPLPRVSDLHENIPIAKPTLRCVCVKQGRISFYKVLS